MDVSDNNILVGGREDSYDIRNYKDGIFRKKINDKFIYYYIKNNKEISQKDLNRIKKLGIPPAWENLWVTIDPKSKIQAVGIDNKGRKQYRYHTDYIEIAEKKKFLRLLDFIKSLPNLENYIKIHSKLNIYDKLKVITTMLKIVKLTYMRVGKEQYARENKSYGISSLKKTHMKINGDIINFNFKGKSKQRLNYVLINHDIKSHLQILQKLEGEKLFQYIDIDNKIKKITDKDLNEYIQTFMGKDFTIKDFRTYAANYHFINFLLNETKKRLPNNDKIMKKNILTSLKKTAKFLKHTKAISKKSYVMNFISFRIVLLCKILVSNT
jgi:DNA topoisomerase-1